MVNQKVLVVPYQVRDSLWRGGHKIKDLMDFTTACKLLSRNEIAILHKLQDPKYTISLFGAELGSYATNLCSIWLDNLHSSNKEAYYKLVSYIEDIQCEDEISARLFDSNFDNSSRSNTFEVSEVPGFGIAVTVFPSFFTSEDRSSNVRALSREVCKTLYKFDCMSKILLSPIGANYVEKLLQ